MDPKIASRIADVYIAKARKDGNEEAQKWASSRFSSEHFPAIREAVLKELEKGK